MVERGEEAVGLAEVELPEGCDGCIFRLPSRCSVMGWGLPGRLRHFLSGAQLVHSRGGVACWHSQEGERTQHVLKREQSQHHDVDCVFCLVALGATTLEKALPSSEEVGWVVCLEQKMCFWD